MQDKDWVEVLTYKRHTSESTKLKTEPVAIPPLRIETPTTPSTSSSPVRPKITSSLYIDCLADPMCVDCSSLCQLFQSQDLPGLLQLQDLVCVDCSWRLSALGAGCSRC
jgi:hypothetical protein